MSLPVAPVALTWTLGGAPKPVPTAPELSSRQQVAELGVLGLMSPTPRVVLGLQALGRKWLCPSYRREWEPQGAVMVLRAGPVSPLWLGLVSRAHRGNASVGLECCPEGIPVPSEPSAVPCAAGPGAPGDLGVLGGQPWSRPGS